MRSCAVAAEGLAADDGAADWGLCDAGLCDAGFCETGRALASMTLVLVSTSRMSVATSVASLGSQRHMAPCWAMRSRFETRKYSTTAAGILM